MVDDDIKRSYYQMVRFTEIHPGNDGVVRAVTKKTAKKCL